MKKLSDIAKEANVSVTTVARYVNQSGYVSKKTQQAIQEAIERIGYMPNHTAKALRNGQSKILGHIVPYSPVNTFFQKLSYSVNKRAYESGYQVLSVVMGDHNSEELKEMVERLLSYQVEGIIFSSFIQNEMDSEIKEYLDSLKVPIVMIERAVECFGIDKVLINSAEGSYMLTRKLLEAGHRDIVYIGKQLKYKVEKERYKGFLAAMLERGISISEEDQLFFAEEYTVEDGQLQTEKMLQMKKLPTAIVAASDILASGVLIALYNNNLRVPEDISVVGYDDTIAQFLCPPLTTAHVPVGELARSAINILIDKLNTSKGECGKNITVSPYVIERQSIRRLREEKEV